MAPTPEALRRVLKNVEKSYPPSELDVVLRDIKRKYESINPSVGTERELNIEIIKQINRHIDHTHTLYRGLSFVGSDHICSYLQKIPNSLDEWYRENGVRDALSTTASRNVAFAFSLMKYFGIVLEIDPGRVRYSHLYRRMHGMDHGSFINTKIAFSTMNSIQEAEVVIMRLEPSSIKRGLIFRNESDSRIFFDADPPTVPIYTIRDFSNKEEIDSVIRGIKEMAYNERVEEYKKSKRLQTRILNSIRSLVPY